MAGLGTTAADLSRFKRQMADATDTLRQRFAGSGSPAGGERLARVDGFGSNPGGLEMMVHVPRKLADDPALVVALHGCGQNATALSEGAGWATLADRYGFVLLLPQQAHGNHPQGCFNWYAPDDISRDSGEALSIRQMIARAAADHGIAPGRLFVTGLSAGGAMAGAMLATYPELFASGAIVAGLPYGGAGNVKEAMEAMYGGGQRPAREWGDIVRRASRHRGPWPTVSIWHGDADKVVRSHNAGEILKQWQDVHGVAARPDGHEIVDGFTRDMWRDGSGRVVIESYTIPGMGHGIPLAVAAGAAGTEAVSCGAAGAFMLDVGISSSYHIARFWGLTGKTVEQPARDPHGSRDAAERRTPEADILPPGEADPWSMPGAGAFGGGMPFPGGATEWWKPGSFKPDTIATDVMDVINKALKTAGLR